MTKEELSKLAELGGEHARLVLIRLRQQMMPQWIMVNQAGQLDIVATPWRDDREKMVFAVRLRKYMRERRTQAYSVVVEAWAAVAPKDWKPGEPHMPNWMNPERKQVVIALATDGKEVEWRQWAVQRDYEENVMALEPIRPEGRIARTWITKLLGNESLDDEDETVLDNEEENS
jgi:hypothetical protein